MLLIANTWIGFMIGFVTHFTRPQLKRDFTGGWFAVACYVMGVLCTFPVFVVAYSSFKDTHWLTRITAAWAISFGSVGFGVIAGHYVRPDRTGGKLHPPVAIHDHSDQARS